MNLNVNLEWILKAVACLLLILAGFGKIGTSLVGIDAGTGILGSMALAAGLWLAAPIVGGLLTKKTP